MALNFKSMDSLNPIKKVLDEAASALNDPSRTIKTSDIPDVLGAALGAGAGGALGFAGLWGLGVAGLSAAGMTSALATAGALVGGGMAAGVAVLAAPAVVLSVAGYGVLAHHKKKKLLAAKQELYAAALKKQNAILEELRKKQELSEERIKYLESLNIMLTSAIKDLNADLAEAA